MYRQVGVFSQQLENIDLLAADVQWLVRSLEQFNDTASRRIRAMQGPQSETDHWILQPDVQQDTGGVWGIVEVSSIH